MVYNTLTVGAAVAPTVIETCFSHYLNRKPLRQKPTAHISYHIGLQLVRQFIAYSSHHHVEDLQGFTAQWVPSPRWVRVENVTIPQKYIDNAVQYLQGELGPTGIGAVGGTQWWQWRPEDSPLKAEWVEMRKDYTARNDAGRQCKRSMLYVHGGAYYFGSVDEHRYQIQRHARKLQARVLCPRYRLAPQFPFPCGLLDCLAAYLYLLTIQPPDTIVVAGDSAGGGMIVSLLVILRDQGLPLPTGGILLSPWVDLTHSFPSVAGWNEMDYVPSHGFMHVPSLAWPPSNDEELQLVKELAATNIHGRELKDRLIRGGVTKEPFVETALDADGSRLQQDLRNGSFMPALPEHHGSKAEPRSAYMPNLTIVLDDEIVEIKDQIQIYTTNTLISHPLVSPILQPSLGGLPPLLVLVGGGEMLRDEQIYLAEKAAHPSQYPPPEAYLAAQGREAAATVTKWPPTNVQLQVWEDMCHVAPTLSFTRPAKYMYRSVAQFGAWCLARAQKTEIEIVDDDDISVISGGASSPSSSSENPTAALQKPRPAARRPINTAASITEQSNNTASVLQSSSSPSSSTDSPSLAKPLRTISTDSLIGKAGSPLPPFTDHMIRQLVTRHGIIHSLPPSARLPACQMDPSTVGYIKPGPVSKWLIAQKDYSKRYASAKLRVQIHRIRDIRRAETEGAVAGLPVLPEEEQPPPTAMAGRPDLWLQYVKGERSNGGKRRKWGTMALKMWSGWGSRHDGEVLGKQEEVEKGEVKGKGKEAVDGEGMRRVRTASVVAVPDEPEPQHEEGQGMMKMGNTL